MTVLSFGNLVHIKHQIMAKYMEIWGGHLFGLVIKNDTYNTYQVAILINYNFASGFGTKSSKAQCMFWFFGWKRFQFLLHSLDESDFNFFSSFQNCIQSSIKPVLLITGLEVVVVAAWMPLVSWSHTSLLKELFSLQARLAHPRSQRLFIYHLVENAISCP